ncbi:hypothetical protein NPS53_09695 [Pseudomonas putida]|uniref:hypothetical protein n=1 Tax=Pseudomonas putida TaxID=303 RepID=UPI002363F19D|nr:hypothetical protein [Pseudomonas putida]MDD2139851.1 hypothetical protein [Pseudomonas putida]HDS1721774.1 hypothetical protein [Pseudomonas putida]
MTFSYTEALSHIRQNPTVRLVGYALHEDSMKFEFYELYADDEDENGNTPANEEIWIGAFYEGGKLFCSEGVMGEYSLETLPDLAASLRFVDKREQPAIGWMQADGALFHLFPTLPDPEGLFGKDRQAWTKQALLLCREAEFVLVVPPVLGNPNIN